MDFFWFFLGIFTVAVGLRNIKQYADRNAWR